LTVGAARWQRASDLVALVALVGLAAIGCSDIHPEPNVVQGGVLDSPTHEADAMRHMEERQERDRRGRGGAEVAGVTNQEARPREAMARARGR
jgi:hypothetical protein